MRSHLETLGQRAGKPAFSFPTVTVPPPGFCLPRPFPVASFMYYCGDNMRTVTTHAFLLCGSQLQLPQGFLRPSYIGPHNDSPKKAMPTVSRSFAWQ
jgi:hypothetical protein